MPATQDNFYGYAVLDSKLNQLQDPFPFSIRKRVSIPLLRRDDIKMTLKLNRKFEHFYSKTIEEKNGRAKDKTKHPKR